MAFYRNPKPWLFLICLYPLARLLVLAWTDGLGVNPIEFVTRSLGTWTLTGLLLTLAVTPLRKLSGYGGLLRYRRMLGLFAFFYGTLHLLSYLWLDQFFDWAAVFKDILKRPFITFGMAAFLLLLPLALTSTHAAMRRLGRNWQRLHWLVYPAAIGAVLHYGWLVKKDLTQPLIYGGVLTLLLGFRVFWFYKKTKAG
ncbi:MAG: sulfoxide reductase heme-binding subunit YedZ [Hydrogenophilaceae bacterium]|nr:sulfoxide reductase heme-binding subunit YedZ [Hydrogenophilaceae bacterium]